jgi:hypothetical protein
LLDKLFVKLVAGQNHSLALDNKVW